MSTSEYDVHETSRQSSEDEWLQQYQQVLARVLNFSLDDLEQNRQGHLVPGQYRAGNNHAAYSFFLNIACVLVAVLVLSLALNFSDTGPFLLPTGLLILLTLLVLMFLNTRQRRREKGDAKVENIEGPLFLDKEEGDAEKVRFFCIVQGPQWNVKKFEVSRSAYGVLQEDLRHRVYFVAADDRLMSVEPLETPDQARERLQQITTITHEEQQRLQNELAKALGFTLDDLEYNRRGQLSPAQLRKEGSVRHRIYLAFAIAFCVCVAAGLYSFLHAILFLTVAGSIFACGVLFIALWVFLTSRRVKHKPVMCTDGLLTAGSRANSLAIRSEYGSAMTNHYFLAHRRLFAVLVDNLRYCIYYRQDDQNRILSIEPLEIAPTTEAREEETPDQEEAPEQEETSGLEA